MNDISLSTLDRLTISLRSQSQSEVSFALKETQKFITERRLNSNDWRNDVDRLRDSSLFQILLEDPLTNWAYSRPMGYPGDASVIDLIYGTGNCSRMFDSASPVGKSVFFENRTAPVCRAVRYRRWLASEMIQDAIARNNRSSILAIAAGHLRELDLMTPLSGAENSHIFALDQDPCSLSEVSKNYPHVETLNMSVSDILRGWIKSERFDLVYALGLFDYLNDDVAKDLLKRMVECCNPDGRILVACFAPTAVDRSYMEAFMNWPLIWRDETEMANLAEDLPPIFAKRTFLDPFRQMAFLELTSK